jgi:hypothetical protein
MGRHKKTLPTTPIPSLAVQQAILRNELMLKYLLAPIPKKRVKKDTPSKPKKEGCKLICEYCKKLQFRPHFKTKKHLDKKCGYIKPKKEPIYKPRLKVPLTVDEIKKKRNEKYRLNNPKFIKLTEEQKKQKKLDRYTKKEKKPPMTREQILARNRATYQKNIELNRLKARERSRTLPKRQNHAKRCEEHNCIIKTCKRCAMNGVINSYKFCIGCDGWFRSCHWNCGKHLTT